MLRRLACAAAFIVVAGSGAATAQSTLNTRPSKFSVEETTARLTKVIESKGIKIAARVDHAAGAKAAGLALPPMVVLLFGNPKLGTPLMQSNPHVGIDLPMRMLIWQDGAGKVWVSYTPPATLQARHDIKGRDAEAALKTMTGALDAFAKAATSE